MFEVIASLLACMAVGWAARRAGLLSRSGTTELSRLVTYVAFPSLCLSGLAHMDPATLARDSAIPVLGFATHALAALVGLALAPIFCRDRASRPTFVFTTAIGNWIFLPLPLASALYGTRGATVVLLHNAGAQVFLWTAGLALLRGGGFSRRDALALLENPGLIATLGGLFLAVASGHLALPAPLEPAVRILDRGLGLLGSLTIPLATLGIGAQIGGVEASSGPRLPVIGAVLARMVFAPAVVIAAISAVAAARAGLLDGPAKSTELLIAAMPVSVSAAAMAESQRGDADLAARATLITTLLSLVTVPLLEAWAG